MAKVGRPKKYTGTETRITIRVDEARRKRLRQVAVDDDVTMADVVNTALTQYLNRRDGYRKQGEARK